VNDDPFKKSQTPGTEGGSIDKKYDPSMPFETASMSAVKKQMFSPAPSMTGQSPLAGNSESN
jgi:hypothetical protein